MSMFDELNNQQLDELIASIIEDGPTIALAAACAEKARRQSYQMEMFI